MKKYFLLTVIAIVIISCNRTDDNLPQPSIADPLKLKSNIENVTIQNQFSREDVNNKMINDLSNAHDFRWSDAGLNYIWSAAEYTRLIVVGYKPVGLSKEDAESLIGKTSIHTVEWKSVHDAIINMVVEELNSQNTIQVTPEEIISEDDIDLPLIIFKIADRNVIEHLYNLENVRYIEPYGYWPYDTDRSSSGCNASGEPLNAADWTGILPNALLPWNYNNLNIPQAWNIAQGNGIKLGIIDAGISSSQALLNADFQNGYSNVNRSITTSYTYGNSAFTSCTHGTSMSALAAGPRNDQGTVSGIAYKSSLYFVRACNDVVLDESAELSGVKNALTLLGKNTSVKIISMSVGTPFYSGALYDGVSFAYNKGKLIFAAAGTSFSWTSWYGVIYPAQLAQCVAVTGVNESGSTCSTCHDGNKVLFTIPMERNINDNRNGLSLPFSGTTPTYIGGSSCATAMCAGIASLVWSVKPSLTRTQVLNCLKTTSQYYPSLTGSHGYGNVNASAAVQLAGTL
jgi:serine protease